jgi:hypothetical protein
MSVYIVTYDLNREVLRPNITGGLRKAFPNWARLSESSYAIDTPMGPGEVLAQLRKFIDANDNIYVVTLKKPYSGFGPQDVNEWLEARLTY